MATWSLQRFSNPALLKLISPDRLTDFLMPFQRYLLGRRIAVYESKPFDPNQFPALIEVLLQPDAKTPPEFITALHLVDEMATEEGMNALWEVNEQQSLGLSFGENPTPLDVAITFWLSEPRFLEMRHAERTLEKTRSYEAYQSSSRSKRKRTNPTPSRRSRVERQMEEWFLAHERGHGVSIIPVNAADGDWYLIRHGGVYQREERHDDMNATTICFRPAKYDIVHFVRSTQELRINARSRRERELYRSAFGDLLFGDPNRFVGIAKYSLDPLRTLQEDALAPGDVEGIESITLREVRLRYGGEPAEVVTLRSTDLFECWSKRGRRFPESGQIVRASIQIRFSDSKSARTVTIRPPNHIQCSRDSDAIIVESWLRQRGFVQDETANTSGEVTHAALVRD